MGCCMCLNAEVYMDYYFSLFILIVAVVFSGQYEN